MINSLEIEVPAGTPRTRLEDYLFDRFRDLSRMYLREIVRDEKCEVNGRHENVGFRVRGGDFIEIEVDPSRGTAMRPQEIPLDIVFEDEHLIVVNKPHGMLVHPTHRDKNGTLLNALTFYLNAECGSRNAESAENAERGVASAELGSRNAECGVWNAEFVSATSVAKSNVSNSSSVDDTSSPFRTPHSGFTRPGLVHRLDKQTSGLMVIAKSVHIHRALARQFQKKLVEKKYLALVEGAVEMDEGIIDGTIGRYAEEKRWDIKVDGKHALTRFSVLERRDTSTLVELEPVTGRTNQLRIHCASIGHPIIGDVTRGGREYERLCLHAWKLSFRHPIGSSTHLFERSQDFS